MREQSTVYSKNPNGLASVGGKFQEDSESKDNWANEEITEISERILQRLYGEMRRGSLADLSLLKERYLLRGKGTEATDMTLAREEEEEEDLKPLPSPEITVVPLTEQQLQQQGQEQGLRKDTNGEREGQQQQQQQGLEVTPLTWKIPMMFDYEHHSSPYEVPLPPISSLPLFSLL
jgi:hypothetical protein